MKPFIAIAPNFRKEGIISVDCAYVKAIENAGGIPFVLPITKEENTIKNLLDKCDGLLLTGGGDIAPAYYGEEPHPKTGEPSCVRDEFDFFCFHYAYHTKKPVLAICRGLQIVNVALGGTLYQDLPLQFGGTVLHNQKEGKFESSHFVNVRKNTPLYAVIGKQKMVANSFHHQAIKKLANGLEIMACAEDNLIEAVYAKGKGYLRGYQWHPERLSTFDEDNRGLFLEFVSVCAERV